MSSYAFSYTSSSSLALPLFFGCLLLLLIALGTSCVFAPRAVFALLEDGGEVDDLEAALAGNLLRRPLGCQCCARGEGRRRRERGCQGRVHTHARGPTTAPEPRGGLTGEPLPEKVAWMTLPTLRLPRTLPPTPSSPMQSQMSAMTRCVRAPDPASGPVSTQAVSGRRA